MTTTMLRRVALPAVLLAATWACAGETAEDAGTETDTTAVESTGESATEEGAETATGPTASAEEVAAALPKPPGWTAETEGDDEDPDAVLLIGSSDLGRDELVTWLEGELPAAGFEIEGPASEAAGMRMMAIEGMGYAGTVSASESNLVYRLDPN